MLPSLAHASVFLDGSTTGCSNGSTNYNPATRSCGSGSDKVYLDLSNFSSNIAAGQTNYMRAGSYFRNTGNVNIGSLHVAVGKSGTASSPTVIKAYTGEERQVLIGTALRGATYNSNPSDTTGVGSWNYYPNPSLETYDASYVTIDGVKTFGQVYLAGGHDVILQNSDCGGGGGNGTITSDQGNTIRMNSIYAVTIRNNKIHHNSRRYEDPYGTAVIGYTFTATITGNTFYDVYGNTIENKDALNQDGRNTEISYNFFGPSTIFTPNPDNHQQGVLGLNQNKFSNGLYTHHNIFYGLEIGVNVNGKPVTDDIIYNNTFVNCGSDIVQHTSEITNTYKVYNNVFFHAAAGQTFHNVEFLSELADSNWNIYYNAGNWQVNDGTVASTLANWKTFSSLDGASIASNPNFVNSLGSNPEDFKRTSYVENFTGSSYGSKAGAYETGSEQIGVDWSNPVAPADTIAPAAPSGLNVQ